MQPILTMLDAKDLHIPTLGPCEIHSPVHDLVDTSDVTGKFVNEEERVLLDNTLAGNKAYIESGQEIPTFELAGPRDKIYFDPAKTTAAIVTCGGLCPGINDVIRDIVMTLYYRYGVRNILGIPYGYEGFVSSYGHEPIQLTPDWVSKIHNYGGSALGSSRGQQADADIVDFLEEKNVNVLFVIGGDGTMRGSLDIGREVEKRNGKISIVGIPKTIDNDLLFIDKSFGFETAFAEAEKALNCAHTEAIGAYNGVGLVNLMGRHSGFIAAFSALAVNNVNFVLVPEVPFDLDGPNGFLEVLRKRLENRHHAVIALAEGAGQEHLKAQATGKDASGNAVLKDIGLFLKQRINDHFDSINMEVNIKYIDPSYIVRSVPASPQDSVYCSRLAQCAVHAAMAGRTKVMVGRRHGKFIHLPVSIATSGRKQLDPHGDLWLSVLEATGQPISFR